MLRLAGAAEVIDQKDLTGELLAERLIAHAGDSSRRAAMGAAARRLARPDAAQQIVDRLIALASGPSGEAAGSAR
jgi:UDP-N-acetylglucosamine--N-acetylmuramyl-(pentapeptide) pyrophosphoryl-undecaprenol N-acetylglucosamine transferase